MGKTTEELNIKITGDSKSAKAALKRLSAALKKSSEDTKKSNNILKNFKDNWLGITAALAGTAILAKKALDFTKEFTEMQQGMAALARNTGKNADEIVSKLNEVSRGTVDNKNLMLAANRAVALNVTKDVGEMAELLDIARLKAKAFGITTTQGFNDLVTGIGRGSPLILDNLGIITKGWAEEAKAAGGAMNAQFILNKVLKQGREELKLTGARVLTSAEKMQAFTSSIINAKLSLGKAFSKAVLPVLEILTKLAVIFTKMPDSVKLFGAVFVATFLAAIAIVKVFGLTLTVATGGISALVGVAVAGAVLLIANWDKVKVFFIEMWERIKFAWEVSWAAIKVGLLSAAAFMLDIAPKMFAPWFIQFDLIIKGLNLLPKVNIKTLTQMTADLKTASEKQGAIEKTKFDALLEGERKRQAAVKRTAEIVKQSNEEAGISFDEFIEKIKEMGGIILPIITELSTAIFSIGDQIHKNIMANLKIELAEKQGLFDTDNKFTAQLAAMDATARTATMNGLKAEIIAAKAAGNTELANEKQLALDRMVLEDAASDRAEVIAEEKAGFEREAQIKIATAEHKAAKFSKAKAVAESILGTAAAVVKALPNIPLSIAVGILGGIKTGIIGAQQIPPIPSFAMGGDFIARGPQYIKVGDNPGQEERVTITPSEQGGGGASIVIQSLTVMANNVNEMADSIFDQAELAGARPFRRGGFA